MPTFNQLVRKGREQVTYKSPEEQGDQPQLPSEERRLHRGPYLYAQEAELCSA